VQGFASGIFAARTALLETIPAATGEADAAAGGTLRFGERTLRGRPVS